ncbi:DUF262 domain-containing protein [Mucilaginibacter arboris]|uniref:DUF262 domain-containing protein n=1 Tax=Mucilaginibacter arboris TaxID=2682090 RepID=A0A7K1SVF0_9SPHI|nr:DUF262 domain-containing protein [Mucilaginibacter arboris]MVN21263.1 DUF262 domain-containing protein [Mucilaginibacter arboris]
MQPTELTISKLLGSDQYIIPLYQRNYAWGVIEVNQLLQDVWDMYKANANSNYYIGTLVVDKKKDNGYFEIIDGQQRHTTITLINSVINGNREKFSNEAIPNSNLHFDARKEIKSFIGSLFTNYENAKQVNADRDFGLPKIKEAVRTIESFFTIKEKEGFDNYFNYFYNKVKIIRIEVPPDTDINHYFEIMNNRGEQLEKHELLKARFLSTIDAELREKFALIWNACSQMDRPIQSCFNPDKRKEIFGGNYDGIPENYLKLIESIKDESTLATNKDNTLSNLLQKNENLKPNTEETVTEDKYKSVVDFPNFLLQVLSIQISGVIVALDDKKLLDEFGYTNKIAGRKLPPAIEFINSLLKYRTLFDKYIIKREEANDDWGWKLSQPKNSDGILSYKNTFSKDNTEDAFENKEFIMVQSMLQVSFPGNNNKNWLKEILIFFQKKEFKIFDKEFLEELNNIAKRRFKESKKLGYNNGTSTHRYLFNYLDYLLWKEYNNPNVKSNIPFDNSRFNSFRFTQNNSVEHLHPQKDIHSLKIIESETNEEFESEKKILDHFGNLCLISQSSNSKYSDYNFHAKKEQFNKKQSVESLKQQIMFSYSVNDWNTDQIKKHGEEMILLLENSIKN